MKCPLARTVSSALALVLILTLALAPLSCSSSQQRQDVTGIWRFKLTPIYDYDEANQKVSTTTKPATYEVSLYDYDGTIVGFSGPFQFQGSSDGDKVRLDVLQAGGEKELSHEANLDLTVVDAKTISGKSIDGDLGHEHRGIGLSEVSAKRIKDAPPLKSLHSPSWVIAIMKLISGWAPGTLFFKNGVEFTFMANLEVPVKSGGGYYMMGDWGPGDEHLATWTVYYPLEWGSSGDRKYKFSVRSGDKQRKIDTIVTDLRHLGHKASQWLGYKNDVDGLISDVRDFHTKYGDFAISLAQSDYSHNYSIYVSLKDNTNAGAAKKHRLISKITGSLKDKGGKTFTNAGTRMDSEWTLRRPVAIVDGTAMFFMYLLGNIEVHYR